MTGLLVLSGDPTAPLQAATKGYVDTGLGLRAPLASPTFTGIVSANGGRVIITDATAPSLTLNNTTFNSPVFGIFNAGNQLQIGQAFAGTGNISGAPLAAMDNAGNWGFGGRVSALSGRLISTSGNLPSVTLNNTAGGAKCWGLWSAVAGTLAFGLVDPAGTPTTSPLAALGADGGLTLTGQQRVTGGAIGLGPIGSNSDVLISVGAGPVFNISTPAGGNLNSIGLFANTVTIVNGSLAVPIGSVKTTMLEGGPSNSGTLRSWGATNSVSFRWASGQLHYRIDDSLDVQICTATNAQAFQYTPGGGPAGIVLNGSDNVGNFYGIYVDGISDAAVKENIADSPIDALDLIGKLRLRAFDYLPEIAPAADRHIDLGLVAQEVAEIIPAMVPDVPFDDGFARINLKAGVPYLIRAVQQLTARLAALEGKK